MTFRQSTMDACSCGRKFRIDPLLIPLDVFDHRSEYRHPPLLVRIITDLGVQNRISINSFDEVSRDWVDAEIPAGRLNIVGIGENALRVRLVTCRTDGFRVNGSGFQAARTFARTCEENIPHHAMCDGRVLEMCSEFG